MNEAAEQERAERERAGATAGSADPVSVRIASVGNQPWRRRMRWLLVGLGVFWLFSWAAGEVPAVIVPLIFAALIAYLLAPLVSRLERWRVPRAVAVIGIVVLFAGILGGLGAYFGPTALRRLEHLPSDLADTWRRLADFARAELGVRLESDPEKLLGVPQGKLSPDELRAMTSRFINRGASIVGGVIGAITVPILALFLLYDYDRILGWFKQQVPPRHRRRVVETAREVDVALGGFVRGQLLVAAILAVLYAVGFAIVGTPYPIAIAVIAGLGNFVPYVGTGIGILLATAVTVLDEPSITKLLLTYGVFAVVQFLEGWIITPRIVGQRVGLPALAVLLAVLVFGEMFGLVGVFLAVPITAILRILGKLLLERYHRSPLYRAMDDEDAARPRPANRCTVPGVPRCSAAPGMLAQREAHKPSSA